jgi:peptide/nickel transport system permease protein
MNVQAVDANEPIPKSQHMPWLLEGLVTLIRTKPLGVFGGSIVILFILTALFAEVLSPYPYHELVGKRLLAPCSEFLLGTDYIGRDLLSRILMGARISVLISFGTVILGTTSATIVGTLSAYFGGKLDVVVQRVVDSIMAFPWFIMVITIISILGQGIINLILTFAFLMTASNSRIVRSAVLAIKENQYIEAAEAMGAGHVRLICLHILPNVIAPIIVIASVNLGRIIITETAMSFLGLGVPPPYPSWGAMLSGDSMRYFDRAAWLVVFPMLALVLTVFSLNMFGDALRDVLDPRLRTR